MNLAGGKLVFGGGTSLLVETSKKLNYDGGNTLRELCCSDTSKTILDYFQTVKKKNYEPLYMITKFFANVWGRHN